MTTRKQDTLVIQALGNLKDDIKAARQDAKEQFNLLVEGQKSLFKKFSDHEAEDNRKFEDIHIKAAETKGEAKQTAKMWGLAGLIPAPVAAGAWELWKYLHGVK